MQKTIQTDDQENKIRKLASQNNEPEWLLKRRLDSYEKFKETPMPNFIYGLNINMDIDLNLDAIDTFESSKRHLSIKSNNNKIQLLNFNEALKSNESIIKKKLMSLIDVNGKFNSFHQAYFNNLTFVYIPENVEVTEPIELSSTIDSTTFDHLIVLADDNSKFTLVENSNNIVTDENNANTIYNNNNNNNNGVYMSKIVELFIGKNCIVNYGNVQLLNQNTFNFTVKKASVGSNSILNWMDCCFGSKVTLSEVTTLLDGEGAKTNNHGIFFGNKNQQFDLVANSIHNAQNTSSDIFTKGALTGNSKCVYRGLVKINQNSPKSNGYQKEDTLLLSEDAQADSIPNLEIDNNDVRCTHGASIGRVDKEKMFYLQSRGLNPEKATQEYVKGFFDPLIQKIQIQSLRESMQKLVEERMAHESK
jgi:Fe-S cluster assembly protein SufD